VKKGREKANNRKEWGSVVKQVKMVAGTHALGLFPGSKQIWRVDRTVIDKWTSHQYLKTDSGTHCEFV
jgi:hypothetical protein